MISDYISNLKKRTNLEKCQDENLKEILESLEFKEKEIYVKEMVKCK